MVAAESLAPDSRYCACAAAAALRRLTLKATTSDARISFLTCVTRGMAMEAKIPSIVTMTTSSTRKFPWLCEQASTWMCDGLRHYSAPPRRAEAQSRGAVNRVTAIAYD